jgi:predicted small metal-binding protein
MRVIECDVCGDTVTAATDDELASHLAEHLRQEHDQDADPGELAPVVAEKAYDATDS